MSLISLILVSQSGFQIIKVYYLAMTFQPSAYYIDQKSQKFWIFFASSSLFTKADFNSKTLSLVQFNVYSRNQDHSLYFHNFLNTIIMNPLNSTSWDTDSSWYLKVVGGLLINDSQIGLLNALYMDKFNFNFAGAYWDPLQTAQLADLNSTFDTIEEAPNIESKLLSIFLNILLNRIKLLLNISILTLDICISFLSNTF